MKNIMYIKNFQKIIGQILKEKLLRMKKKYENIKGNNKSMMDKITELEKNSKIEQNRIVFSSKNFIKKVLERA